MYLTSFSMSYKQLHRLMNSNTNAILYLTTILFIYTLKPHLCTQMFYLRLQTQNSCICKQKILVQANSKCCCTKKHVTYIKHPTCLNLFQLQFKCKTDICVKQYRHIFKQCTNGTPDLRATIDVLTMYRIATDPERFPERHHYPAKARKKGARENLRDRRMP